MLRGGGQRAQGDLRPTPTWGPGTVTGCQALSPLPNSHALPETLGLDPGQELPGAEQEAVRGGPSRPERPPMHFWGEQQRGRPRPAVPGCPGREGGRLRAGRGPQPQQAATQAHAPVKTREWRGWSGRGPSGPVPAEAGASHAPASLGPTLAPRLPGTGHSVNLPDGHSQAVLWGGGELSGGAREGCGQSWGKTVVPQDQRLYHQCAR